MTLPKDTSEEVEGENTAEGNDAPSAAESQ